VIVMWCMWNGFQGRKNLTLLLGVLSRDSKKDYP